jgi:hypothetical protein
MNQLSISWENLCGRFGWLSALCGRGLRTWQYNFLLRYQRIYRESYHKLHDAHGIIAKVGFEQGWLGIVSLVLIFQLMIRIVFSTGKVNLKSSTTILQLMVIPCAIYLLTGTNYYQPVLWIPLSISWLILAEEQRLT